MSDTGERFTDEAKAVRQQVADYVLARDADRRVADRGESWDAGFDAGWAAHYRRSRGAEARAAEAANQLREIASYADSHNVELLAAADRLEGTGQDAPQTHHPDDEAKSA